MAASLVAKQSFAERITYLAEKCETVAAFSRTVGVSDSTARKWMRGEAEPRRDHLVAVALSMGVRLEWLAMGVGPIGPTPPETEGRAEHPGHNAVPLDDRELLRVVWDAVERALLQQYTQLTLEQKVQLFAMVSRLVNHAPLESDVCARR